MSRVYRINENLNRVGLNTLVITNPNSGDINLNALRANGGDVIIKIKDESPEAVIMIGSTNLGKEHVLKAGVQNNFVCKNTSELWLVNKQNVSIKQFPYLYNVNAENLSDVSIQTFYIGVSNTTHPEVNVECCHFPRMESVTSVQIYNSGSNISFADLSMILNATEITLGTKIGGKIEDMVGCLSLSSLSINKSGNSGDLFKLAKNQYAAGRTNGTISGGYWTNGNTITFNGAALKFSANDKIEWNDNGCILTNGDIVTSLKWDGSAL